MVTVLLINSLLLIKALDTFAPADQPTFPLPEGFVLLEEKQHMLEHRDGDLHHSLFRQLLNWVQLCFTIHFI